MSFEAAKNEHLKLDDASLERLNSSKGIPEQLKKIYALLNSYGVEECEPNVPMMLLELITRTTSKVLQSSKKIVDRKKNGSPITCDAVDLAIRSQFIKENIAAEETEASLADSINSIPLSFPIQGQGTNTVDQKSVYGGVILPEPHLCQMAQSYTIVKNENMQ